MADVILRRATCLCGASGLTAEGAPLLVTLSSAPSDQTLASAPVRWTAWYAESQIRTSGTFVAYRHVEDEAAVTYWRCASCGTQLWHRAHNAMPGTIAVNAGALSDPDGLRPDRAISGRLRPAWLSLDPAIPDGGDI